MAHRSRCPRCPDARRSARARPSHGALQWRGGAATRSCGRPRWQRDDQPCPERRGQRTRSTRSPPRSKTGSRRRPRRRQLDARSTAGLREKDGTASGASTQPGWRKVRIGPPGGTTRPNRRALPGSQQQHVRLRRAGAVERRSRVLRTAECVERRAVQRALGSFACSRFEGDPDIIALAHPQASLDTEADETHGPLAPA